jgi:hypothetical protein
MKSMEKHIPNGIKDVWLPIPASRSARNTINPIRRIVDRMKIAPNPSKEMISLSIGDPTHYGNMLPPVEALEAIVEAVQLPTSHGYAPSFGRIFSLKYLFIFLIFELFRYIRCTKSSCSLLVSTKLYIKS